MLEKIRRRFAKADPKPKATPVEFKKNLSTDERIRRISDFSRQQEIERIRALQVEGFETFEDADDFDVVDPSHVDAAMVDTPYEADFDLATAHANQRGIVADPDPAAVREAQQRLAAARSAATKKQQFSEQAQKQFFDSFMDYIANQQAKDKAD